MTSGELLTNTDAAYSASFDYWLLNASLRYNIHIGLLLKENWYWEIINACCLLSDIQNFPCGDLTEIGERGVNLSGGQKARIGIVDHTDYNQLVQTNIGTIDIKLNYFFQN